MPKKPTKKPNPVKVAGPKVHTTPMHLRDRRYGQTGSVVAPEPKK